MSHNKELLCSLWVGYPWRVQLICGTALRFKGFFGGPGLGLRDDMLPGYDGWFRVWGLGFTHRLLSSSFL